MPVNLKSSTLPDPRIRMPKVKVALAGVGNVASAIVQGAFYYSDAPDDVDIPGIMHPRIGPYSISDIEFVAAFDVDSRKTGRDLSEAIFSKPNVLSKFVDVPQLGIEVKKGPVLDGVADHMREFRYGEGFRLDDDPSIDLVDELEGSGADVLVNIIPVGSYEASREYARACLETGVSFLNGIPEFIVSDAEWAARFEEKGIPVAGDDFKSQLGATILHRTLAQLFLDRGIKVTSTYQLNIGGNTDFLNMVQEERLMTKRKSKTEAVTSLFPYPVETRIGPSDFVPQLEDTKVAFISLRGEQFGGFPLELDLKLSVMDSPNAAGVAIDAIRALKLARDRGLSGPVLSVCAYLFKHPPRYYPVSTAKKSLEDFISGTG